MAAAAAGPGPAEPPAAAPELKSRFRTREGSYRLLGPAAAAAAAAGPAPAAPAPAGPRGAAAGAALGGAAGPEPQPARGSRRAQPRVLQPRQGAALLRRGRQRGTRQPEGAGPAAAHRQARVQGHAAHVPRLQPVHGGRRDAAAARGLLGRPGAVPGPGQEGQRRAALQRGAPHRQVQGDAGEVAAGHRAPVPGVARQRPPVPVRLGAALRGHQPAVHAGHAGRGLQGLLLQEQDPSEPAAQVGRGLGAAQRVRLLAGRALAGVRQPGRRAQGLPLLLHAAAGHDEELLRGAALRLLEPRRPLRGHRRRGRPGHRVVVRRGTRGGPRARPQVVGQRRGFRSLHASPAAAPRRAGGRRDPRGAPERHVPLRLGRPGHAVLPVGPDRGRAGPPAAPSPRPPRRRRHRGPAALRAGAAALAVPLQQPPAARRGSPGLAAGPPGAERGALRHADPAGPPRRPREGAQTLPQPGQHQPGRGQRRETPPRRRPGGLAGVSGHGQGAGHGAVPAAARGAAAGAAGVQENRPGEADGAAVPGGLHRDGLPGGAHLHLGTAWGLWPVLAERRLPEWHRGVAVTCVTRRVTRQDTPVSPVSPDVSPARTHPCHLPGHRVARVTRRDTPVSPAGVPRVTRSATPVLLSPPGAVPAVSPLSPVPRVAPPCPGTPPLPPPCLRHFIVPAGPPRPPPYLY